MKDELERRDIDNSSFLITSTIYLLKSSKSQKLTLTMQLMTFVIGPIATYEFQPSTFSTVVKQRSLILASTPAAAIPPQHWLCLPASYRTQGYNYVWPLTTEYSRCLAAASIILHSLRGHSANTASFTRAGLCAGSGGCRIPTKTVRLRGDSLAPCARAMLGASL